MGGKRIPALDEGTGTIITALEEFGFPALGTGTIITALEEFGFTKTGRVFISGIDVYAHRSENSDRRYLGPVENPEAAWVDIQAWFEANRESLPDSKVRYAIGAKVFDTLQEAAEAWEPNDRIQGLGPDGMRFPLTEAEIDKSIGFIVDAQKKKV